MEPRKEVKQEQKPANVLMEKTKQTFHVVKLEERIAPALNSNHNESLVRDAAKAAAESPPPPAANAQSRLRIIKLEERIAPALSANHNETLLLDA